MRKILIVVVSLLVPFGLWTAGCRQNRQAAFPNSPEMKSLARAPEQDSPTRAPVIPAAPIDRDILNLPEQTTMAKVNAVNDKSNAMAGPRANPGLFVLPEDGQNHMASAGGRGGQSAGMTPIPSGREFWSRPASMPANSRPMGSAPQDVSAMMPAAPVDNYATAPYPSSPVPPPASEPYSYGAPAMPYAPPAPSAPPASYNYGAPAQGGDMLMLPEDIPGVFMDTDLGPLSLAPGQPPTRYASPVYSAHTEFTGTAEFLDFTGDALGAPPLSSSEGFASVPVESIGSAMRESAPETGGSPIKLDLAGLLGSMREITDTLIPATGESVAQAAPAPARVAETPEPAAGAAALPPLPDLQEPGAASAFDPADIRLALAPLPDVSAMAAPPAPPVREAPRVSLPPPVPEPLPPPEMVAAKAALLDYTPPAREGEEAPTALGTDELFRTDSWSKIAAPLPPPAGVKPFQPAAPAASAAITAELPELRLETPAVPAPIFAATGPDLSQSDAPQKVKLQPMRASRIRQADLREIDASTAVPPLKF